MNNVFAQALQSVRPDMRQPDQLRPVEWQLDVAPNAAGSVMIRLGQTQVICAVTIEDKVPRWMIQQGVEGGWLTAEYSLLPYSTTDRTTREAASGKISGRTSEIQRLIGRALRAVVDLKRFGKRTVWIDCDVVAADGGTRTAALTGSFVALRLAVDRWLKEKKISQDPILEALAAVSVGVVAGRPALDLCYAEDSTAAVDMNVVMTASGRFIELQGTAEHDPFTREQLDGMMQLAEKGIRDLMAAQKDILAKARKTK